MEGRKTTAIVFEGGKPQGAVPIALQTVRDACCLDMLELLLGLPEYYEKVMLATNFDHLAAAASLMGVQVVRTPDAPVFHFGKVLQELVREVSSESVLYLSGAGSPLLSREELIAIAEELSEAKGSVITNNVQSSDIAGWAPREAIFKITPPTMDNSLGYLLRQEAGLSRKLLPHSVGVHFDIDTPADVLMLKQIGLGTPRVRQAVAAIPWDSCNYQRLWELFLHRGDNIPRLWMSGRIGGPVIQHINTYMMCRLRVVSEERGMKSMGQQGMVNSFVGSYLAELGSERFFRYLEQSGDAALIDTRPLFEHFKLSPDDNDRFSSDLLLWQDVQNPWVREFTQAAARASIPVILGGHTLILGGIWAFVDGQRAAQRQNP